MANLDSLIEDIDKLFDQSKPREVSEEHLEIFARNMKDILRDRLSHNEQEKRPIRFSGLGKPPRQVWYDANPDGTEEKLSPTTLRKFLLGDIIEQFLLFLVREAGHSVDCEQAKVELDGVTGSIDCFIDDVLVDVKSASPFGFKKFEDGSILEGNDSFHYIEQLAGYANVLTPNKPAAWLAMDKVSGDICIRYLPVDIINQHKPEDKIESLKNVLERSVPPERCYQDVEDGKSGNRKLGTACGYCSHKRRCWPEIRTFLYSSGPRFFTKVVKEPNVFEV